MKNYLAKWSLATLWILVTVLFGIAGSVVGTVVLAVVAAHVTDSYEHAWPVWAYVLPGVAAAVLPTVAIALWKSSSSPPKNSQTQAPAA